MVVVAVRLWKENMGHSGGKFCDYKLFSFLQRKASIAAVALEPTKQPTAGANSLLLSNSFFENEIYYLIFSWIFENERIYGLQVNAELNIFTVFKKRKAAKMTRIDGFWVIQTNECLKNSSSCHTFACPETGFEPPTLRTRGRRSTIVSKSWPRLMNFFNCMSWNSLAQFIIKITLYFKVTKRSFIFRE